MYNKQMLMNLIEKCRETLHNSHDYVLCNQLLNKINASMLPSKNDNTSLNLNEIIHLTDEEISMFTSSECKRIISSFKVISNKKGWRRETVIRLIKSLEKDIAFNKMQEFKKKNDSLEELSRIIEEGLFKDNYNLILDLIKLCVDNKFLSVNDAVNLNFYILRECSSYVHDDKQTNKVEVIELDENTLSIDDVRKRLQDVFSKYGYVYDEKQMAEMEDSIVRYSNIDYVDYILSKFKEYGIDNKELYIKKRVLFKIIIDRDKETFDSIIKFIDENKCTLSTLLSIPAVFAMKKRSYVRKNQVDNASVGNVCEVYGSNTDFFNNIELYKKLSGNLVVTDEDLNKLMKFLCMPSELVNKNLMLLERYGIVEKGKLPKTHLALCGNYTEYIIDRIIEIGLYDEYLGLKVNQDGQVKQARGAYSLEWDNNPLKFYKMKRALGMGSSLLAVNGGIKKEFKDDSQEYMGISCVQGDDGEYTIIQKPLSLREMKDIDQNVEHKLINPLLRKINDMDYHRDTVAKVCFEEIYKYNVYTPTDIFAFSGDDLRGERITGIFDKKDFKRVITDDEINNLLRDPFIKLLDNTVYCDSNGNSKPLKISDLEYEFYHPSFPGINIIISRHKVLRLCKLLKEAGCFIKSGSSYDKKENTLLSVIVKDTILNHMELTFLRFMLKEILTNELIKVPNVNDYTKKRGVR